MYNYQKLVEGSLSLVQILNIHLFTQIFHHRLQIIIQICNRTASLLRILLKITQVHELNIKRRPWYLFRIILKFVKILESHIIHIKTKLHTVYPSMISNPELIKELNGLLHLSDRGIRLTVGYDKGHLFLDYRSKYHKEVLYRFKSIGMIS